MGLLIEELAECIATRANHPYFHLDAKDVDAANQMDIRKQTAPPLLVVETKIMANKERGITTMVIKEEIRIKIRRNQPAATQTIIIKVIM